MSTVEKTRCSATNRAGGPCRHPVVLLSGLCVAHDAEHIVSQRFQAGPGHTIGPGRPARPPAPEVLREVVERQIEKVLGVFLDGLDADEAQVRMAAARELMDRAWGKPRQSVDTTIEAGESLAALLAPTPLERTDYERLPEGWEGTDG